MTLAAAAFSPLDLRGKRGGKRVTRREVLANKALGKEHKTSMPNYVEGGCFTDAPDVTESDLAATVKRAAAGASAIPRIM
jgi:hypothetical protein